MSNTPKLPYVLNDGFYQYNLQWLVNELLSFKSQLDSAIDLKTIHYADPLHWDITTQYAPNTVVVDQKTGTAYMSKQPVPAGILLTNTDYWVVVFNYKKIYEDIKSGIASNEGDSLNASRDYLPTELIWYGNSLYRATRAITEGSVFIPDTNITPATIAGMLATYYGRDRVAQVLTDTLNVSGTYKLTALNAIIEMDGDLTITAGDIAVNADNKTETFTGDVQQSGVNKTETFTGDVQQSGVNKTETFTGDVQQSGVNKTETFTGDVQVNAESLKVTFPTHTLDLSLLPSNGYRNVLDYGVDNNGNTDCTSILSSLQADGIPLYFPKGKYLIKNLVVSVSFFLEDTAEFLLNTCTQEDFGLKIQTAGLLFNHLHINVNANPLHAVWITVDDITIGDITVKNYNYNGTQPANSAIYLNNADNFSLNSLRAFNFIQSVPRGNDSCPQVFACEGVNKAININSVYANNIRACLVNAGATGTVLNVNDVTVVNGHDNGSYTVRGGHTCIKNMVYYGDNEGFVVITDDNAASDALSSGEIGCLCFYSTATDVPSTGCQPLRFNKGKYLIAGTVTVSGKVNYCLFTNKDTGESGDLYIGSLVLNNVTAQSIIYAPSARLTYANMEIGEISGVINIDSNVTDKTFINVEAGLNLKLGKIALTINDISAEAYSDSLFISKNPATISAYIGNIFIAWLRSGELQTNSVYLNNLQKTDVYVNGVRDPNRLRFTKLYIPCFSAVVSANVPTHVGNTGEFILNVGTSACLGWCYHGNAWKEIPYTA